MRDPHVESVEGLEGGVIEDARARQRRLRRRGAVAALGGAALVALIIGLSGGGGASGGHARGAGEPLRITFANGQFFAAGLPIMIAFTPGGYNGGGVAYFRYHGSFVVDDGAAGGGAAGGGARVLVRWESLPADRDTPGLIMVAIVGHGVAAAHAAGVGTFTARHVTGLPAGYRAVVFYYPHRPALASVRNILAYRQRGAALGRLVPFTPLDATGQPTAAPSTRS